MKIIKRYFKTDNKGQAINASNSMSKKACLEACDAAMQSTAVANEKNTAEAHKLAASHHRIAAESASIEGDEPLMAKHKDLAEQHDLAASRCSAAAGNKVLPKDGEAVPVVASAAVEASADEEGGRWVTVEGHPVHITKGESMEDAMKGGSYEEASRRADSATKSAKTEDEHNHASDLHTKAGDAHYEAAKKAKDAGDEKSAGEHAKKADSHYNKASAHASTAIALSTKSGKERNPEGHLLGKVDSAKASGAEGLEAGNVSDTAAKKSAAALAATTAAHAASQEADETGTKEAHQKAIEAHDDAHDAHSDAAKANLAAGSPDKVIDEHLAAMENHKKAKSDHESKMAACESGNAAEDTSSLQARVLVHTCHNELQASGCNPDLDGVRHEVLRLHGVNLSCEQVGEYLLQPLEAGPSGSSHPFYGNQYTGGGAAAITEPGQRIATVAYRQVKGAAKDYSYTGAKVYESYLHKPSGELRAKPVYETGPDRRSEEMSKLDSMQHAQEKGIPYHPGIRQGFVFDKNYAARKAGELDQKRSEVYNAGASAFSVSGKAAGDAAAPMDATGDALESGKTDDLRSLANPDDSVIMYMPGGIARITPSQGGKPVTVCVKIDEISAERMEEQRAALCAAGNKPFFSVQHNTQIAAFWPTKFFWDRRIDATGSLVSGVWAEGEWTKAGKEAVEGKNFRTFSPTFFVDKISNDEDNPAEVECNINAKLNMGALENDPAFEKISPLWCAMNNNNNNMNTRASILECHAELKSSRGTNFTLDDMVQALRDNYGVRLTAAEVGEELEAGDYPGHEFHGNQYSGGESHGKEHEASLRAHLASAAATDKQGHQKAAAEHMKAAAAHNRAGDDETAAMHEAAAKYHISRANKFKK